MSTVCNLTAYEVAGSVNVNKNTSNLYVKLTATTSGESYNLKSPSGTIKINGTTYNYSKNIPKNTITTLYEATHTIVHNTDGTKSVGISYSFATGISAGTLTGSTTVNLSNIPRYASISHSLNSVGLNFAKINWHSDSNCDILQYSINGGNWLNASGNPYTISGLSPNVNYKIKTRVRRKDSGLYSQTGDLSVTTKDIARISRASNFNHGDNTVVGISNPASATIKLRLIVSGITIFNKSVSAGNNTIGFNDTELDNIYKKYGSGNSVTATFILDTYNGSSIGWTNSKNVTIYLKGNQKTIKENINGTWRRGKTWVNVNGTWRRAVVWLNINGSWKRGI